MEPVLELSKRLRLLQVLLLFLDLRCSRECFRLLHRLSLDSQHPVLLKLIPDGVALFPPHSRIGVRSKVLLLFACMSFNLDVRRLHGQFTCILFA